MLKQNKITSFHNLPFYRQSDKCPELHRKITWYLYATNTTTKRF
jgi:hypothetical protein